MAERVEQLKEYGFAEELIEAALKYTQGGDISAALDWINEHQDKESITEENEDGFGGHPAALQCSDCGRLFSSVDKAQYHAFKTGHESFSESKEVIPQLTEEQKKENMENLKLKLAAKRTEEAKKREREDRMAELLRRKSGQNAAMARQELEEKEMKKAAEQMRKDKEEEKRIRERIRAEMEEEKRVRKLDKESSVKAPAAIPSTADKTQELSYCSTRIQVKTTSGVFRFNFAAEDQFSNLVDDLIRKSPSFSTFKFVIPIPRRVFTDSDKSKTFKELGLCPSATIILE